ncbi:MAG: Ig-like domain-containing protein, partial [Paludibacteraceae bacterium]|nr:Ig-like domain-containing protein [Paludibacteraceae bacterium]
MRKFFIVAISIAVLFGIAACKPNTPTATLSLSTATLQLKVGDMSTLETSGTATNIEWSSSDEEVATVYYGVVTAKSIGKTVVKAYSGDVSAECIVYVSGTDGTTLRISPSLVSVNVGETYQFSYGNTYDLELTWTSSDAAIASVSATGLVTANKPGNAVITLATPVESVEAVVAVAHKWGEYKLVWSDEFNGSALDESVWNYNTGGSGWGNNEKQYYTKRAENIRVQNGCLEIEGRKEQYENNEYTSARIHSKGK